jgi:hypothetical protein
MSPCSEPRRWSLGHVPRPTRPETPLVSWLPAHLTHALCSTGVLAVAVVAASDLGWALEAAAVVLVAWAAALVEAVVLVAQPGQP